MKRFDDYGAFRKSAAILKYGLERRTAAAERLLAAADLPTTFRALDIGTADGSMLKVLEGVFPSGAFLGMERSMRLCKVARANGLTVTCGDARRLPFLDGSFDLVLMCATLKHIREYQQVLAECRRVTVRAGYLVLSDPTPLGMRVGVWMGHFDQRYLPNVWSLAEMCRRIEAEGFHVIARMKYMLFPFRVPGASKLETMLRSFHLTGTFLHQAILTRKSS